MLDSGTRERRQDADYQKYGSILNQAQTLTGRHLAIINIICIENIR